MKHYILYYHGGSSNHGCEALVRTTAGLLDYRSNKVTLSSFSPESDKRFNIDKICDIHAMFESKPISKFDLRFINAYRKLKINKDGTSLDDLSMLNAIGARKGDVALSIGGDNYCYGNYDSLIEIDNFYKRNKLKTVLWGCSVHSEVLSIPAVREDISKFDLITARESISYNALKEINENTVLVSDSAFMLNSKKKPLPVGFENSKIVGINLSSLAEDLEQKKGITRKNYETLIDYILSDTDMKILMIPHVTKKNNDDRVVNHFFYEKYGNTKRIVCIDDCSCEELKGYISRCSFFIGARTHATIAAYSSCVPTLVLGYSVKSRGIARDLFGDETNYVVPVQSLTSENELLNAFKYLLTNETFIRDKLTEIIKK